MDKTKKAEHCDKNYKNEKRSIISKDLKQLFFISYSLLSEMQRLAIGFY